MQLAKVVVARAKVQCITGSAALAIRQRDCLGSNTVPRREMTLPHPDPKPDRRAFARHLLHTQASLVLSDGQKVPARTLDISKGGLGVVADLNARVGTKLGLSVSLPIHPRGSAILSTQVVVANCVLDGQEGGFRMGLMFFDLDAQARQVLARVLP